jgi:hypothetical protein
MPTWPVSLPAAPMVQGLKESVPNTVIRTPMETGPPKLRQRFTAGVRPLTLPFLLTKAQVATLDTFYVTTLKGGSLTFDGLNHPRTGAAVSTWAFVKPPEYTPLGPDAWQTQLELEIRP